MTIFYKEKKSCAEYNFLGIGLGLGLEVQSLGLGLGLEVQGLGLGLKAHCLGLGLGGTVLVLVLSRHQDRDS